MMNDYAVVHLVSQEMTKNLIGSQVIDHMQSQATVEGDDRPTATSVVFLESARRLGVRSTWKRRSKLAQRAPNIRVAVLPVVGRWSSATNARVLAMAIQRMTRSRSVVFHCRGESAAVWAAAVRRHLAHTGSVVDVRGATPEEVLFARGFDGPEGADEESLRQYEAGKRRLRRVLGDAGAILTVSESLARWLVPFAGGDASITVVPCCVARCVYDAERRRIARQRLGLEGKLVLAYLGTLTGYQHVEDGALAFIADAARANDAVHFLALTNEPSKLRAAAQAAGIATERITAECVDQEEVPSYLIAADAGLLLRRPSTMNRVSMPVKLGEYLSCGVPVIVSRMTGWVDELVGTAEAGIAIDWFGQTDAERSSTVSTVLSRLTEQNAHLRDRAAQLCRDRFVWQQHTAPVREAYIRALCGL